MDSQANKDPSGGPGCPWCLPRPDRLRPVSTLIWTPHIIPPRPDRLRPALSLIWTLHINSADSNPHVVPAESS